MQHKLPPIPVRILVLLIIVIGGYYAFRTLQPKVDGALTASGSIEATNVNVSPEMAGKVKDVLIEEGQSVKAGDPLLSLDDSLLVAQRAVADAQLDSATSAVATAESALAAMQVQYDLAFSKAVSQSSGIRTADWYRDEPSAFSLPLWYYTQTEQINAALAEVDSAKAALADAESNLVAVQAKSASADFVKAETDLAAARATYQVTKDIYDRIQNGDNIEDLSLAQQIKVAKGELYVSNVTEELRKSAKESYDDARVELDSAQAAYDDAVTTDAARDVLIVRAEISITYERYYTALDYVLQLQTGESSPTITSAQKALEQAQASVDQAKMAIGQAEANLALIDTQIAKLTVYAPMDGVILTRNVEPGEFVQPGATAFAMADLNNITITVYVPEDRYGQIKLGQQAQVTVDSFPGETFNAEVIHISDKAEFTPRNVQTVEGRSSTVYAIKLKVTDSEGKLKIGMPADVTFSR
jgi:HlyD family secretion protein